MAFKRNGCYLFFQTCLHVILHFYHILLKLEFLYMNHLLLSLWFFQELRTKKNDMESEEEKNLEDVWWNSKRIVTMATIKIQMVAMDSSVFSACVLCLAEIWLNWRSSEKSRKFWWIVIQMRFILKVLFQITFWVKILKKHLEKQYLKGKMKCPGH